ncbi:MAG: hypothetical protein A3E91_00215 [Candidatus Moranbacteria bacterium RIFCSPHIGHO2_12_FULL_40_10]|nr:MAG: hypothetical protein A3E91_00215 [Candidatus Moranbacteria bacterium RIFCSPHIGHO2_12_FULL_40_10]
MEKYNPRKIEQKWQKIWQKSGIYKAKDSVKGKNNFYHLVMFPYPSGDLHIGHWYNFAPADVFARFKKMQGFNVMSPIGFDSFGLPAENAAIKRKIHPRDWTYKNIQTMKKQLQSMGNMHDWSREIITSDPGYYKWTQWMFLQLYKNGLACKKKAPANWCPKCHTVLANEQVINGKCERCETEVVQRDIEQWLFRITKYADKLLEGLDKLDWPEKTKIMQRNWIGRSEGATIKFQIVIPSEDEESNRLDSSTPLRSAQNDNNFLEVFTTRLDTIYGCTYCVVAPEHPFVASLLKIKNQKSKIKNFEEVEEYMVKAQNKTELERMEMKEKTGVEIKGIKAVNPFNNEEMPIFVADYVLGHYGTGAVMAVPAHDERDWEFAKKYNLPIKKVIEPCFYQHTEPGKIKDNEPFVERDAIAALVKHWEKDEYIGLKWKKVAWQTLITGGVEKGQTDEEAAGNEITEETGYKNLKLIKKLPMVHSKFYHIPKKENRFAHFNVFYFELENGEQEKISNVENDIHEVVWVPKEKMTQFFTAESHNYIWQTLDKPAAAYTDEGVLNNSGEYNYLDSREAREKMTQWLEKNKLGRKKINYKLRDWLVSRQRYWGAPIPIIYCSKCWENFSKTRPANQGSTFPFPDLSGNSSGLNLNVAVIGGKKHAVIPVPEKDLPVKLPNISDYLPTEEGSSPLARSKSFVNAKCPRCKGKAVRETDTLDTFVCSSWYYLRYADPRNRKKFADGKKLKTWLPVNMYIGGAEHTVLHLLYSRFFAKALKDFGYLDFDEPFSALRHQGTILGNDSQKMSKSKGNIIDPDKIVENFGSDAVKMYLCFMGEYSQGGPWNPSGIMGVVRFIERIWKLKEKVVNNKLQAPSRKIEILLHKTIKKVTEDIENFRFNTAISQMMMLTNELEKEGSFSATYYRLLITILSPFAPHITEELWNKLGNKESIFKESWPSYNPELIKNEEVELVIQINGKVRDTVKVSAEISGEEAKKTALGSEKIKKWTDGKEIKKVIFIKGKLVNVVI